MTTPISCDATNWVRILPVPGGLSTRDPSSTVTTSSRKERARPTSEPEIKDLSVAINPAPSSESQIGSNKDGSL
ncbi:Uncharacterised protein [Mycobacterium tuberculosis]|nr:Uncharacterised protein [Mycobacterium tuberculosis]COZ42742.1 Uncharacterised protein [Mycobacterium tuberculosis]